MSDTHPQNPMIARSAGPVASAPRSAPPKDQPLLAADADPDTVVDEILTLLDEDRYPKARRLASEALARFPEHVRVERVWNIFDNRGKTRVAPGGPEPSTREEFEWLQNPPEWAHGKWVALIGSEAVASADTLAEVLETLGSRRFPKKPLVHRIADGW